MRTWRVRGEERLSRKLEGRNGVLQNLPGQCPEEKEECRIDVSGLQIKIMGTCTL